MTGPAMLPSSAMLPSLAMWVAMMTAMMLPSAVPAITRRARSRDGALAAPRFAGSYLGIWALAGLYELTPLKRICRQRCRERVRSGLRFGVYCLGSSIGLMLVLVAVDAMSVALMVATACVVLVQKLLPPHPAVDVPLALAIVALGVVLAAN